MPRLFLSFILFLCLISVVACQEGKDTEPTAEVPQTGKDPIPVVPDATCLITKTVSSNGIYSTMVYDTDKKLIAFDSHAPANIIGKEVNSKYTLTRDKDGRMIKMLGVSDDGASAETFIDYNESGQWIKTKITNTSSPTYVTVIPEYNQEGLIVKITRENVNVNNPYTNIVEYSYENGNITTQTDIINNKPILSKLEYDFTREVKWSEYDLLRVYLGESRPLHKNELKKIITSTSVAGSPSVNNLIYQYNDKGYALQVSSVSVFNGQGSKPLVRTNTFQCE